MGADIAKLRSRMARVRSTQHLTRAMGLVASSKCPSSVEAMRRSRAFAAAFDNAVTPLINCRECAHHPYLTAREGDTLRLIVIAGDRGMAGGYTANVFRLLRTIPAATVIPIGKRACERYKTDVCTAEHYAFADARQLATTCCAEFMSGAFDRLGIVYTRYHSPLVQEAVVRYVLPFAKTKRPSALGVLCEPDAPSVLQAIAVDYMAAMLFACVKESVASEYAARRMAMEAADTNAQEMLQSLQRAYNRARQGAITQEITEIIAGSG